MLLVLEINSAAIYLGKSIKCFMIKPMLTVGFDEHCNVYETINNLNSKLIGCCMYELLPDTAFVGNRLYN